MNEIERLNWVYGNLAASTNHKPSLEAFWSVAQERGWSREDFDKWAKGKRWWIR